MNAKHSRLRLGTNGASLLSKSQTKGLQVGDSSLNQQNEHFTWELVNQKLQVAIGWGSLGATGMGVH